MQSFRRSGAGDTRRTTQSRPGRVLDLLDGAVRAVKRSFTVAEDLNAMAVFLVFPCGSVGAVNDV
jgi:cation transport regulator ChaC